MEVNGSVTNYQQLSSAATLIVNKARGILKVAAVKAPDFGDRRKLILEDIAILTGGQVFSAEKGMKLDKFDWGWFGKARVITITKDTTTIIDGKGEETAITQRVEELQQQIERAKIGFEQEKLQERLAKFIGGVAIIHVGGNTETEMKEKKDRVDDALHATKAAIEEGIVPGGGATLIHATFFIWLGYRYHHKILVLLAETEVIKSILLFSSVFIFGFLVSIFSKKIEE